MKTIIKNWGNSASIRVPSAIMQDAKFHIDQTVDIRVDNGQVIIRPINPDDFNLTKLLAEITEDNQHDEVDFGKSTGKENW